MLSDNTQLSLDGWNCFPLILNHVGRFGSPEVIHTDQGLAFPNELVTELIRLSGIGQSFATAYSSEENGIVERANQEVLRHHRRFTMEILVRLAGYDESSNSWKPYKALMPDYL